ncbi:MULTISPECIES: hypothetical protein [Cellulosimicrobium]|uniref:Preprotein translocase subunit SecB n=1 Tax=Cellulosimicrobium protaetiae TaxID=2587808 RepID=A0A6M5UB54_9MICO|nr:hypothetical protein [Cellulosimicrobium protaetiae]QJW35480.1 hypothetical protein FIC82_003955 [Cellulosimicrobium protaetiae]
MRLSERGFGGIEAIFTLALGAERRRIGPDPETLDISIGMEINPIEQTVLWRVDYRVDVRDQRVEDDSPDRGVFGVHAAYAVALSPDVELDDHGSLVSALWPHARAELINLIPPVAGKSLGLPMSLDLAAVEADRMAGE